MATFPQPQALDAALIVGTWVQIVTSDQYDGLVGPIDWIDQDRDNNPYGVDLTGTSIFFAADELFFAADELLALPGQPEGDPRLTRLVVLDRTDYLLVATSLAQLDADEQELREIDRLPCA